VSFILNFIFMQRCHADGTAPETRAQQQNQFPQWNLKQNLERGLLIAKGERLES
jgi:hypothetical protein